MPAPRPHRAPLLVLVAILTTEHHIGAQGTLTALTWDPGAHTAVGYTVDHGVGWSFVPTTDIWVTGIAANASELTFWRGPNRALATFTVLTTTGGVFNSIAPLPLLAGQRYFVSCQAPGFAGATIFAAFDRGPGSELSPFYPSPYLDQYRGGYFVAPDGTWTPRVSRTEDWLLLGPNFQFQPVPEPTTVSLMICAMLMFVLLGSRRPPWLIDA